MDLNIAEQRAKTEAWIEEHPNLVEVVVPEAVSLWLQKRDRTAYLQRVCKTHGLNPLHLYRVAVMPVERYLQLHGSDWGRP